ncbi:hypothetical protein LBMAG42_09940 [Deltaproteobacteria bacterium]|nr:hypothetical protein LBMAG42_09940 [Deltaproteobacteria bacterium]
MLGTPIPRRDVRADDHAEVRRRLVGAVARHCPAWLRSDADDIVQHAMLRVVEGGATVVNATYLNRVAYCATIDEIRRRRARKMDSGEEVPDAPSAAPADNPGRIAEGRQVGEAIRDCLAGLNEARCRAVGLYLEGNTVPEIARVLDTALKNAENLVYRGLEGLRSCLAGKGVSP